MVILVGHQDFYTRNILVHTVLARRMAAHKWYLCYLQTLYGTILWLCLAALLRSRPQRGSTSHGRPSRG